MLLGKPASLLKPNSEETMTFLSFARACLIRSADHGMTPAIAYSYVHWKQAAISMLYSPVLQRPKASRVYDGDPIPDAAHYMSTVVWIVFSPHSNRREAKSLISVQPSVPALVV